MCIGLSVQKHLFVASGKSTTSILSLSTGLHSQQKVQALMPRLLRHIPCSTGGTCLDLAAASDLNHLMQITSKDMVFGLPSRASSGLLGKAMRSKNQACMQRLRLHAPWESRLRHRRMVPWLWASSSFKMGLAGAMRPHTWMKGNQGDASCFAASLSSFAARRTLHGAPSYISSLDSWSPG